MLWAHVLGPGFGFPQHCATPPRVGLHHPQKAQHWDVLQDRGSAMELLRLLAKADSPSPRGCCSERKRSQGMWGMADLQTSFTQNQINLIISQRDTRWFFWLPDCKANRIKCWAMQSIHKILFAFSTLLSALSPEQKKIFKFKMP